MRFRIAESGSVELLIFVSCGVVISSTEFAFADAV